MTAYKTLTASLRKVVGAEMDYSTLWDGISCIGLEFKTIDLEEKVGQRTKGTECQLCETDPCAAAGGVVFYRDRTGVLIHPQVSMLRTYDTLHRQL